MPPLTDGFVDKDGEVKGEMKKHVVNARKASAAVLVCLTVALMLSLTLPAVRATTNLIYKTNDTPYSVDGYETGQTQYCYHTTQPPGGYGYVKVGCSHTASCCYRMEAEGTYSGSTGSKTICTFTLMECHIARQAEAPSQGII
jgi:hypothetical protein